MKKIALAVMIFAIGGSAFGACDNKTLTGDFRVSIAGNDNGGTCGAIGIANFDGKKTMTFTGIQGCGGSTIQSNGSFTYTVLANCMGSAINTNAGYSFYFLTDKKMQKGSIFASTSNAVYFGGMEKQ